MRTLFALLPLLLISPQAQAQTVVEPEVTSSAQTGGQEGGREVQQDPTSLAGRGGPAVQQKTYQATIGTPIGTEIRTEIGTRMGVPH